MATYSEMADRNMDIARETHGGEGTAVWPKVLAVLAAGVLATALVVASGQVPAEPSADFTTITD